MGEEEEEDITLETGATIYWVLTTRQVLIVYYLHLIHKATLKGVRLYLKCSEEETKAKKEVTCSRSCSH